MALVARCPKCNTAFRIVPDQLKISDGWVRCGKCSHVFNAASTQYQAPEKITSEPLAEENNFKITRPPEYTSVEPYQNDNDSGFNLEDEGYELTADVKETQQTYIQSSDTAFADTLFSDNLLADFHIGWVDADDTDESAISIADRIPKTFEELQHRIAQKRALKSTPKNVSSVAQAPKPPTTVQTLSEEDTSENRFTESVIGFGESLFSDSRLPEPLMPVRRLSSSAGKQPDALAKNLNTSAQKPSIIPNSDGDTIQAQVSTFDGQEVNTLKAKQENVFDFKNAIPVPPLKQNKSRSTANKVGNFSKNIQNDYLDDINDFNFASTLQNEISTISDPWSTPSSTSPDSGSPPEASVFKTTSAKNATEYKTSRALERLSSALKDNEGKEISFIHDDQSTSHWKTPVANVSLIAASFLLIILFFAQTAIVFRDPVATQYPALRPVINSLCKPIGCQAGYIRDPNRIALSTSFDVIEVDGKTIYQLGIMTHNRSAEIVEIPWYELSIFDANGNLVGLKVLSPEELYINRATLKPREEFFVERYITVNIPGLTAKNYNLSFFYP